MFDAYIRKAIENDEVIFPSQFCKKPEKPGDEKKKSLEGLHQKLKTYLFSCCYLNNPLSDDLVEFKESWFQKAEFTEEMLRSLKTALTIISVDPAFRKKESNDYSGLCVTKVPEDGSVIVMEAKQVKKNPQELVAEIFSLVEAYSPVDMVVVETVQAQVILVDLLQNEMRKRNVFFTIEQYDPGTQDTKQTKIRRLISHYSNGRVFHRAGLGDLERQLIEFPRGKNDDIIDALQAQIPYWKGKTVITRRPAERGTLAWLEEIRRSNRKNTVTATEKLFEDLTKKSQPVTTRKPLW